MFLLTLAADPVSHSTNHPFWTSHDGIWLWSAYCTQLVIAGLITVFGMKWVAGHLHTDPSIEGPQRYVPRHPVAHLIEVICVYLRDEVCRPLLGSRTDKLMPFLWSLFFFILVNNMLGLVPLLDLVHLAIPSWKYAHISPIGGTATQSIFVTGVLAFCAAIFINLNGVKELGIKGYLHHLTAGSPWPLWFLIIPLEIISTFIKPIALAIRLFANMTAGHILLAQLLAFTGAGFAAGLGIGLVVWFAATFGSFAVYLLEIFVGFLQAFIFMFLTAVFTSLLAHEEHHDEHHDHDHAHLEESGHSIHHAAIPAA